MLWKKEDWYRIPPQNPNPFSQKLTTRESSNRRRSLQGTHPHDHPAHKIILTKQFSQAGKGLVKVNGKPLALTQPEILRFKVP